MNALLAAADLADDQRHIASRLATVGQMAEAERPALRPLPAEAFDPTVPLRARVDRKARISVRGSRYSVPTAYAGRSVEVRLGGARLDVLAAGRVIAQHERSLRKGAEVLVLDHYLEVLLRKPGALPGASALAQARAAGRFTAAHERFWRRARRRLGDAQGTRALIEVLLWHRRLPFSAVHEALDALTRAVSAHPALVAIEARRIADRRSQTRSPARPRLERFERPAPSLAGYDLAAAPSVDPLQLSALERGAWIDAAEPVVLLGDSGTGKSHLLIGLGIAACQRGLRVRYTTAAALVNELAEATDEQQLSRLVARYGRLDLLCLDELNYVHLDPRGAELLFQILTEREERASVAVASNAPFSEWGQTFEDPRLAAAVVDRVTFRAHIVETGSDSYRLRLSESAKGGAPQA